MKRTKTWILTLLGAAGAVLVPSLLFASAVDLDLSDISSNQPISSAAMRQRFQELETAIDDNDARMTALQAAPGELYAVARWDNVGGTCSFNASGSSSSNAQLIGSGGCSADAQFDGPATVSDSDAGGDALGLKLPNAPPGRYYVVAQGLISITTNTGACVYSLSVDGGSTFGPPDAAMLDTAIIPTFGISPKTTFTLSTAQDVNIDVYHRRVSSSGTTGCNLSVGVDRVFMIAVFRYRL